MTTLYRWALRALPNDLRAKHGGDMERLFARELDQARARGRIPMLATVASSMWDVLRRGAYEQVRPTHGAGERALAESARSDGEYVPPPSTAELLKRLAVSFTIALVALTGVLLAQYATRNLPALSARGADGAMIVQFLLLSLPFTVAMTIPMAMFISVIHAFTRLGAHGVPSSARRARHDMRRLLILVLTASTVVATGALVVTTQVLPYANHRLSAVLSGREPAKKVHRAMTVGELRAAARDVEARSDRDEVIANIEVEIHKKFALPAACIVLALTGMALAWRFPRGGGWMVAGACLVVFGAYYAMLIAGESLADRLVISPFLAMWAANVVVLTIALAVWREWAARGATSTPTL